MRKYILYTAVAPCWWWACAIQLFSALHVVGLHIQHQLLAQLHHFFAVHLVGSLSLANNVQHSASVGGCCNDGHLIMPCHQHIHTILIHAAARALSSLLVSNCCRSMYIPSHHIYFVYSQSKYASYTIPGSTLKLPTFNSSCI